MGHVSLLYRSVFLNLLISLHLFHVDLVLNSASFSQPPSWCMVVLKYLTTVCFGRFAESVLLHSLTPCLVLYSLLFQCWWQALSFGLFSFLAAPSGFPLHISTLDSRPSQSSSLIRKSSPTIIAQGVSSPISSMITSMIIINKSEFRAEPFDAALRELKCKTPGFQ